MDTLTENMNRSPRRARLLTGMAAAGLLLGLTACRTTHEVRGDMEESGFLKDYSQLHESKGDAAKMIYIDTLANWSKYDKIYIEPIELWKADDPETKLGKLDKEQQQMLVDYFYTALSNSLSKNFEIVNQAGPGVLVIRGAITEAKKCRPVSNLVSTVMPIGMALSLVKRGIFGTGMGVGECQVEAELLDGATGRVVAAGMDRRAGTKALRTKFDGTFGDVKLAMDFWAERLGKNPGDL